MKWRAQHAPMEAMLAAIDDPLLLALQLDAPYRIADIGCGTGGTTLKIAQQAPAGSMVHGFDVSPALIELAKTRMLLAKAAVAFNTADVATATAPPILYDRLVSRFGIMFFDDPPCVFANLASWLAPGGRFVFAVWGSHGKNPWMTSVREAVADVIELPPLDLKAPGLFRFADADGFVTLLKEVGFRNVKVNDWFGRLPVGGGLPAAEAAKFALASFSSFAELLAEAGGNAFNDALALLTSRYALHQNNDVVQMDACVHIVTGERAV